MTRFRTLFVALVLVSAVATPAHAGGFLTALFAGEEGHVTTSHPSAAYYNPAGLALRGGNRFVLEGSAGYRSVGYDRPVEAIDNPTASANQGGTPEDARSANSGHAELQNAVLVPFAAAATDFGMRNFGFGVSFSVPFGGSADFGKNDEYAGNGAYAGAVDGVQRWSIINGTVQATYLTVAAAYYIPALRVSIGGGWNFVQQKIDVLRARNLASTDDLIDSSGDIVEGRALIEATDNRGMSFGAGLIYEPSDNLRLGLSYQGQPNFGKSTLKGTLTSKIGTGEETKTPIVLEQSLPDIIRVGGSYRASSKLELRAEFDYQRWSVFNRQCVLDATMPERRCDVQSNGAPAPTGVGITANLDRRWKNSIALRGGASYLLTPTVVLMGGVSYDANAVPDSTLDASFVDSNKVLVTPEVRVQVTPDLALAARWTQVFCAKRTTTADAEATMAPTRVPSSRGTYTQSAGLFTLSAEYGF